MLFRPRPSAGVSQATGLWVAGAGRQLKGFSLKKALQDQPFLRLSSDGFKDCIATRDGGQREGLTSFDTHLFQALCKKGPCRQPAERCFKTRNPSQLVEFSNAVCVLGCPSWPFCRGYCHPGISFLAQILILFADACFLTMFPTNSTQ